MRLLTHNYLKSNVRGTENGYPLAIEATKIVYEESPIDKELIKQILQKMNYSVLKTSIQEIAPLCAKSDILIDEVPDQLQDMNTEIDTKTMENIHKVLFDIHVTEGALICPDTGRRFPIVQGIPNMVLHEDEI